MGRLAGGRAGGGAGGRAGGSYRFRTGRKCKKKVATPEIQYFSMIALKVAVRGLFCRCTGNRKCVCMCAQRWILHKKTLITAAASMSGRSRPTLWPKAQFEGCAEKETVAQGSA